VFILNFILVLIFAVAIIGTFIELKVVGTELVWVFLLVAWSVLNSACLVALAHWVREDADRIDTLANTTAELEESSRTRTTSQVANMSKWKHAEQEPTIKKDMLEDFVPDPRLLEKLSKKFIYPEKALKGLIEMKLSQGRTREQAIKEIEEEYSKTVRS
jgi:hypothetical protein